MDPDLPNRPHPLRIPVTPLIDEAARQATYSLLGVEEPPPSLAQFASDLDEFRAHLKDVDPWPGSRWIKDHRTPAVGNEYPPFGDEQANCFLGSRQCHSVRLLDRTVRGQLIPGGELPFVDPRSQRGGDLSLPGPPPGGCRGAHVSRLRLYYDSTLRVPAQMPYCPRTDGRRTGR